MKSWFGCDDLDLIFKVTAGLKLPNLSQKVPVIMSTTEGERDILFYVPHRRGGGHIVFGVDPVDVGVNVGVGVSVSLKLSCLHYISWTDGWI